MHKIYGNDDEQLCDATCEATNEKGSKSEENPSTGTHTHAHMCASGVINAFRM